MEGRLGVRFPAHRGGHSEGSRLPHLHYLTQPAARRRLRPRQGRRLFLPDAGGLRPLARPAGGGPHAEGFAVLPSQGTYFLLLDLKASGIEMDDRTFAERAVREAGVATIPVSAFYAEDAVTSVIRLCFSKKDETIDAGVERLAKARKLFG